jgi:predicted RNase H-like nuclease (RuvC/YqgF family)
MLTGGLMVFSSYKRIENENENERLTNKLKEKQLRIDELESEVEILEDEISEREIEIKFWGMKYDSIKQK